MADIYQHIADRLSKKTTPGFDGTKSLGVREARRILGLSLGIPRDLQTGLLRELCIQKKIRYVTPRTIEIIKHETSVRPAENVK
jgi:hypothetical protein